ncbi:MAG TPA: hypothetical protein VGD67_18670, partial [Pseudonocardiaceae bacterium]
MTVGDGPRAAEVWRGDPGDGPWPGVSDPAGLLADVADWLRGYANHGTRRTYAEGLGLPTSARDLVEWVVRDPGDDGPGELSWGSPADDADRRRRDHREAWQAAVGRYAEVMGITADGLRAAAAERHADGRPAGSVRVRAAVTSGPPSAAPSG